MHISLNEAETDRIANIIREHYESHLNEYDFKKYPANEYIHYKNTFSSLCATPEDITNALIWKWGHWGKDNYPRAHRALISEVQRLWPKFVASGHTRTAQDTYNWWSARFARRTTYITAAYITHLVHHNKGAPIIDQHNFRAMNWLIRQVRMNHSHKKKPSSWDDICGLAIFIMKIADAMHVEDIGELDKFLMMFGRALHRT